MKRLHCYRDTTYKDKNGATYEFAEEWDHCPAGTDNETN